MIAFLKANLQPVSLTTLAFLFAIGLVLLYMRPRWGRVWLTVFGAVYWVLASPLGAGVLAWTLDTGYPPLAAAADARGAQAVVLLGGGSVNVRGRGVSLAYVGHNSALRAVETARVYRLLGDPLVVLSGGITDPLPGAAPESDAYRLAMAALGVPMSRMIVEDRSRTTREQAIILKDLLREHHIDRFVLVTSPLHMGRSLAAFAAQGLHPVPSPAPLYPDRPSTPIFFVPNDTSLEIGGGAIYEWTARLYYWTKGWTRAA